MFEPDPCHFTRAQAGCPESLNALLRQHEGLVQAAVRQQVTGSAAFEELLQAGREGLWRQLYDVGAQELLVVAEEQGEASVDA